MVEIHAPGGPLPHIPDDLTLPQFILDSHHPTRPIRGEGIPWLIEDRTGRRIGVEELRARTFGLANGLSLKFNLSMFITLLIFSPNHVDYPVAIWAVHRLGGIISGANPSYTSEELAYQLISTEAKVAFVHPAILQTTLAAAHEANFPLDRIVLFDSDSGSSSSPITSAIHDLIAEGLTRPPHFRERRLDPGEGKTKIAFLSFSSGTTGRPKAVAVPHYAPIANCIQMAVHHKVNESYAPWEERRFRPGDVSIAVLPFFHIYGLIVNLHFMLLSGLSLVVVPKFHFEEMLRSIVRYRITHLFLVPPQIVLLCKHPAVKSYDLSHIRFIMAGAAPVSAELTMQLVKVLPNCAIGQGYGMTETATSVANISIHQKVGTLGSAGTLVPGVVARVVRPDGSLAKIGEQGELFVKSPANALCYLNNEEATKETFIDGWVRTGDEVIINEGAELFIIDRLKEIMKVRGYQVAPAELEGHLLSHPDVADACVVGVPDEYSGELPFAFITLHSRSAGRIAGNPKEAEQIKDSIIRHVAEHKVHYKHLAGGVHFIDVIPKNPSGKLLRRLLRDQAKQLRAKSTMTIRPRL
ncbi:hypothetical protein JAAARDRAFT_147584 [Jaapia argillacea MUCL 33604]|uniref:AMP-dependent synthetase/ligase domain-containing protein n=1 Tax=Jaapia argillacea MUCL 33604 TaxID=933084 RepID=A0A067QB31_9AGAM|nr:hypothetical protein JAAARDRAFT_147584 [Jaapia argillacea MUCL 33604]